MKPRFINLEPPATEEQIRAAETLTGNEMAGPLRHIFETANGGQPEPFVYSHDGLGIPISQCLALGPGRGSAMWTYKLFAVTKGVLPKNLFPFAVDAVGNYLCVDLSTADSQIVFFHLDAIPGEYLQPLDVSLEMFWDRFVDETPQPGG